MRKHLPKIVKVTTLLLSTFYFLLSTSFAQSPQKMSYQAVIRDNDNALVKSHAVGMRVSILLGSETGTEVYKEIYNPNPQTNANGLVTIEIGGGIPLTGTFAAIDWSAGTYFIKTETDPTGGTSYSITGTSQLLSVPYALYAKTVASYNETDPVFVAWNKSTGININTSQVTDFQTSVTNNSAVLLNTAKNSYPTADATKLAAITGTNTGDETLATIKSKLGITTLNGSNTGDQTLAGLGGVASNTAITGATNTKITYDAKGLVTAGTAATTADIAASTDKNYVTNAQLTVIGNTSGTNTGDETATTIKSKLGISTLTGSNTGDQTLAGLGGVASNTAITGATKTKITYDAKGLVTAGVDATTADISASTDKNYVTDAQLTVIGNTSGTNTGDQTLPTLASLGGVARDTAITGATNTKITYDSKGLVTAGTAATTADIAASTDKNYVTNAQLAMIGNTSGTNSGDNAVNSLYSGLVTNATHTGDATGATALTVVKINGTSLAGLATGILKNTTGTGVPSIAVAGTDYLTPTGSAASLTGFPTLNQNTTGSAASFTGSLAGDVTGTQGATVVSNAAVIGKVLTGYVSGAGTVAATDNILQAIQKLNGNNPTHYIGESYGGGIVFYVYDNGRHGLIAATADQSTGIRWNGGSFASTRAKADGVGAGLKNTAIIIANQASLDGNAFAATVCNEYSVLVGGVTYGDWYLPSKFELNLLYLQKTVVGVFANNLYWSSTEYDNGDAWGQYFYDGSQNYIIKSNTYYVRAIRGF